MGRLLIVLAALAAAWCAHADTVTELKSGGFQFEVAARGQANLIYQLDCMAGLMRCSKDTFEQLWRGRLGLTGDDATQLTAWARLRNGIQNASNSGERVLPVKAIVPIFDFRAETTWDKVRFAELTSQDIDELQRRWSELLPGDVTSQMAAILASFRQRFEPWWAEREPEVGAFVSGIEAAMIKARAGELLGAAAKFYGSELGERHLYLHLFPQPKVASRSSRATLLGGHLTVEIPAGEKAEDRAPVVVHELAHHLFQRMPAERMAWLADEMLGYGPAGAPSWNLLNEVQATIIGNILAARNLHSPERFQKLVDTPQGFYADEAIDRGARAAEKMFAAALKKGPMKPSFPKDFVAALKAGMGPLLETPVLQLRSVVLNVADDNSPWVLKFVDAVRPWSMWTNSPLGDPEMIARLNKYPGQNAGALVLADQIPQLAPAGPVLGVTPETLQAALGSARGIVLITQRTPQAYSFVFVARDSRTMDGLISSIPYCEMKPGVCVQFR